MNVSRPLEGVVIVDLTHFAAGPYCTMLLADAGARVIKVEPPAGEIYRSEGPPLVADDGTVAGSYHLRFNRHKESVVLDLKTPGGRDTLEVLAKRADVLVDNFRPHTLDRLGVGYGRLRQLNERLIYATITGFGSGDVDPSPFVNWPALAIVAEAMGGVMDRIGDGECGPHWTGVSAGDLYAGALATSGILMALLHRDRTGLGQHVDISMVDAMASLNERAVMSYGVTGAAPRAGEEQHLAPFGPFRARDGHVVIGVIGDALWRRFCSAISRPDLVDDPRLADGIRRAEHLESVLRPAIDAWVAGRDKEAAAQALAEAGVPAAPVYHAGEVAESAHLKARRMLVDVELPGYGTFPVVASPIKLSADPTPAAARAPLLGEHTSSVLAELDGGELGEGASRESIAPASGCVHE
jgi:CoA:oxalate CoA-transferase